MASGELAGRGPCTATLTFDGALLRGATCAAQELAGRVKGLPGVVSFSGRGVAGAVHEFMYDEAGNIVGADQPQAYTAENIPHFTDGRFVRAFTRKGRFAPLMQQIPVDIIVNAKVGLLGAAEAALRLVESH